jgi:shikimate kinase
MIKPCKSSRPIVLVGMMGCGKTTIGKILSTKLPAEFFDLDRAIEEGENMKIMEIFSTKGEGYFRQLESNYLKTFLPGNTTQRFVLSVGGGAFTIQKNIDFIKSRGISVFLDTHIDIIYSRIRQDKKRPLASQKTKEEILALYEDRRKFYSQADITIKIDRSASKIKVVKEILKTVTK